MRGMDEEHRKGMEKNGWKAAKAAARDGDDDRSARGFTGFGKLNPPARVNVKVEPGTIMWSPGGRSALSMTGALDHDLALSLLERFTEGDWGPDTPPEMAAANEQNLAEDGRVTAVYSVGHGMFVYLVSDGDRTATTFAGAGEMQR